MKSSLLMAGSLAALLVSACQEVAVESNIAPKNFEEYFKPASVEVYTKDSILEQRRTHSLGLVTGLACQEKPQDFIARESEARLDALVQAADMGANGIVYGKCIRLERTQACHVSVTCYGEAFVVDKGTNNAKSNEQKIAKAQPKSATPVVLVAPQITNSASANTVTVPAATRVSTGGETQFIDKASTNLESAPLETTPVKTVAPVVAAPAAKSESALAPNSLTAPVASQSDNADQTYKFEDIEVVKDEAKVVPSQPSKAEMRARERRNRIYKIKLD